MTARSASTKLRQLRAIRRKAKFNMDAVTKWPLDSNVIASALIASLDCIDDLADLLIDEIQEGKK